MRDNVNGGALTEVTFYILLSLYTPKHGYAVMQFIEEKTAGRLLLGAGTLYGALNSLKKKGWIMPYGCLLYTSVIYHLYNVYCHLNLFQIKSLFDPYINLMKEYLGFLKYFY